MDDSPEYSDPIIIPITITIPDPRFRKTFHHPSMDDPDWYRRQRDRPPLTLAQLGIPLPLLAPPLALPQPHVPHPAELDEAIARARRRAQEALRELGAGDVASAAGHLLLGQPYPAAVDDPIGTSFNNEPAPPKKLNPREARLGEIEKETEGDFQAGKEDPLNERHLKDVEDERSGNPLLKPDGTPSNHENNVAQGKRALERALKRLKDKLAHEQVYGDPRPTNAEVNRVTDTIKQIESFLNDINKRLPNLKLLPGAPNVG